MMPEGYFPITGQASPPQAGGSGIPLSSLSRNATSKPLVGILEIYGADMYQLYLAKHVSKDKTITDSAKGS